MTISVIITRDFEHLSEVAAEIVKEIIVQTLKKKKRIHFWASHRKFTYRYV